MAIPANMKRALDMLPHLARCAKERRLITYKELGDLIDFPAYFLGKPLDVLRDQVLLKHNLPRLDSLVVNMETKEVGSMFYEGGKGEVDDESFHDLLESEREAVFSYKNWDAVIARIQTHYGGEDYRGRG